jgi:hypothetical protein
MMIAPTAPIPSEVELLWHRIHELENERRFAGKPYPNGMAPFPGRLMGQGLFPGGDGLWREAACIKLSSTSPFPIGGIMFLGNDFGTLQTFEKTLQRGYENPPTWLRLKQRLTAAAIPGEVGFYTNAVLGLRTDKQALADLDLSPDFCQFCGEFLRFQLATMKPRLLVVFGVKTNITFCSTLAADVPAIALWRKKHLRSMEAAETIQPVEWRGTKLVLHLTSHPYSDANKNDATKSEDAHRLKQAWETARSR